MKVYLPFVISIGFLVSACDGNKDIDKVKSYVFSEIDNSRDLGTVMSHRDACKSGEWGSEVDSSGRKIVTYSCDIDYEKINSIFSNELENSRNDDISKYTKDIEQLNKYENIVKDVYSSSLSNLSSIKSEYDELKNPDGSISPELKSKIDLMRSADAESLKSKWGPLPYDEDDAVQSLASVFQYADLYSQKGIDEANGMLLKTYNDYMKESSSERNGDINNISEAKKRKLFINLSSAKSIIYFSSNPSLEQPVSFIGMKYIFNNNGKETSTTDGSLIDIYRGREVGYIKTIITIYLINRPMMH